MRQTKRTLATGILVATLFVHPALGQTPTSIVIDVQDVVEYQDYQIDLGDPSKFALSPGITRSSPARNFYPATIIGDIVAVNGQPAKGLYAGRSRAIGTSRNPTPGGAIADLSRLAMREVIIEILKPDGTPVGTIMSSGLSGSEPPPGQGLPVEQRGNWAITGGTGAYLGARGQLSQRPDGQGPIRARPASVAEDPANRRINGGGTWRIYVRIIPMSVPQIKTTGAGPVVVHSSDFSLVTASKPAAPGEILSLFATGLGPTLPDLELGQTFPSSPLSAVNSPLGITANGKPAEILGAVGYPGTEDVYQVNFRMPSDTGKGSVSLQLSAAWIAGTPVSIIVQ